LGGARASGSYSLEPFDIHARSWSAANQASFTFTSLRFETAVLTGSVETGYSRSRYFVASSSLRCRDPGLEHLIASIDLDELHKAGSKQRLERQTTDRSYIMTADSPAERIIGTSLRARRSS
jgi:hypothetical protein